VQIAIDPNGVFTALDFAKISALPLGSEGTGIQFLLTPDAAYALNQITSGHSGQHLVLLVNSRPLAQFQIGRPITNGNIVFFPEVLEDEKATLARDLDATCALLRKQDSGGAK
jgi:hypothetical protein